MPQVKHIHPRGHFFQHVSGGHQSSIDDILSDRPYFGLARSMTFMYGNFRDDQGELYEFVRNFGVPEATDEPIAKQLISLLLETTLINGKELRFDIDRMMKAAPSAGASIQREGDFAVWRSDPQAPGDGFEIRQGLDEVSWREGELWDVSGPTQKPGLHWYLPGRDYGTYYVSQHTLVSGTVFGRPARGWIAFDQAYMGEGGELYSKKDLSMENQAHMVWFTWGTLYTDGSVEFGHFIFGHDRFGFAVMSDGTNVTATQDIDGTVFRSGDSPFADRIELVIDGVDWEFLPDPRGTQPDFLTRHPPTPQQEGRWRRVGDTREPEVWFAWGETDARHGSFRGDPTATGPLA